jgi:uncharacterized protein (UPF0276 family)
MSPAYYQYDDAHLPELGVGITFAPEIEPLLEARPELFDVLEFEPQTSWVETPGESATYRPDEGTLARLVAYPMRKLVHSVGTPVGGTVRPDPGQLALLRASIEKLQSPWASDHLSFNSTPEFRTGFFLPPRQTSEGVAVACISIRDLQMGLGVPVAVETGVNYLQRRSDEMSDGRFVGSVVRSAGCGLLLDLHNIFANALNGRQTIAEFLAEIPLERVWEIHLAGGMALDGFWVDAHSGAIPDPLFEASRIIVSRLPNLKAIIFEIFPSFVETIGADVIYAQLERLRELWSLRGTAVGEPLPVRHNRPAAPLSLDDGPSPAMWERALGNLVIGRAPGAETLSHELAGDHGVSLVASMIKEFRASMLVRVLPMSMRLLLLTLGTDTVRALMGDCWTRIPPQGYASAEAEAFADALTKQHLDIPYLEKVLEFERANAASLVDGKRRIMHFDFDPVPVFEAVTRGVLFADEIERIDLEVVLTGDGPESAPLGAGTSTPRKFPFH